jgi:intracellular multiplication protein IcmG
MMADNKNINDEYQYVEEGEVEPVSSNSSDTSEPSEQAAKSSEYSERFNSLIQKPNVRRNAIIAVAALFVLLGIIKFTSSEQPKQNDGQSQESYQQQQAKLLQERSDAAQKSQGQITPELNQLNSNQTALQNTVSGLNNQVSQLSNQLNTISANNQSLVQELAVIQNKLNLTTQALEELIASQKSKKQITPSHVKYSRALKVAPIIEYQKYYIQAIIPGRAWLISSNGQTLTVTVGSKVPGYGTVRKILPLEGRVVMSSSRVLKYNQEL